MRDVIQRLALANCHYRYRWVGALLRREGWCVNHKRVVRIVREDNLLCLAMPLFKILGWRTPAETFDALLRSDHTGVATSG